MHSTAFLLFLVFLKGVVAAVEPTGARGLPPLKAGDSSEERGSTVSNFLVDKSVASDTTRGRRVREERIPTARDSFIVRR